MDPGFEFADSYLGGEEFPNRFDDSQCESNHLHANSTDDYEGGETDDIPTIDDLTFNENLSDLERVKSYCVDSTFPLQRLIHVKMLSNVAAEVGFTVAQKELLPVIKDVIQFDSEFVIKEHVAEQLALIAKFFVEEGGPQGYRLLLETVIPFLGILLNDHNPEVRISAGESLVNVSQYINSKDMGAHLLTMVLKLAHNYEESSIRITGVVLLCELAETLGKELCDQFLTPEIISLAEDTSTRVKKAVALNISSVCSAVGTESTVNRLLPAYKRLCQNKFWGLRKACTESIVSLSKLLPREIQEDVLIDIFEGFTTDDSLWVRNAAIQNSGPFISTLNSEAVTDALLHTFLDACASPESEISEGTSSSVSDKSLDANKNELLIFCAFSFPAVVLTLGRSRWSLLRETYQSLARGLLWKVRRTLAFSLHEIAKIIGPEQSFVDLAPCLHFFLSDLDSVKIGVLSNLSSFLSTLDPEDRITFESTLKDVKQYLPESNWRLRETLSLQLPDLISLFSISATYYIIVPYIIELLNDPVDAVRVAVLPAVPRCILQLSRDESDNWMNLFLETIIEFSTSSYFVKRQLFVNIMKKTLQFDGFDRKLFNDKLLPTIENLSSDRVVNVRYSMVQLLVNHSPQWMMDSDLVQKSLSVLSNDTDEDVRFIIASSSIGKDFHPVENSNCSGASNISNEVSEK